MLIRFRKLRVWVNGCFDIIHPGHVDLIKYAAQFGRVRVGVDSDSRVKKLKGEDRPINKCADRMKVVDSIKGVDSVVSFDCEQELLHRIKEWKADIIIVGSDYKAKRVIGEELVDRVQFFHRIGDFSTSKIINDAKGTSNR